MVLAHTNNKCAMCGKAIIITDDHHDKKKKQQQQQNSSSTTSIIQDHIDGSSYTFDTADCALMFKKFRNLYGSNFANG
jgi:hypothetical protein